MIFGKTTAERTATKNKQIQDSVYEGVEKFAWIPTQLATGQYAWLVKYYQYCSGIKDRNTGATFLQRSWLGREFYCKNYLCRDPSHVDVTVLSTEFVRMFI